MNREQIKDLIKEAFTENVYGSYPYSHRPGNEEEVSEDFQEEWKRFCVAVVQDQSKQKAIAIAKILIKDVELFEDVLDVVGKDQSLATEILKKMEMPETEPDQPV